MRTCPTALLAALLGLALTVVSRADDKAEKLAAQKKAAEAAWDTLDAGPGVSVETKNLAVWGPKGSEAKLRAAGPTLERYREAALKILEMDPKDLPDGRITVFLLHDREQVVTFIRRVQKRRPEAGEVGTYSTQDDLMHAAAAPSAGRVAVPADTRAGEELAALLLARRVGRGTPLPDWVYAGFGRAVTYRVQPRDKVTLDERKQARALARSRKPSDLWAGSVDADEVDALQGSVVDFLAFGPGARSFAKFLDGFKPEEGKETKSADEALTAAGLTAERIDKTWKAWAAK